MLISLRSGRVIGAVLLVATAVVAGDRSQVEAGTVQPPGLDHFHCYKAAAQSGAFSQTPPSVQLQDEFGSASAQPVKVKQLCNPVKKKRKDTGAVTPITNPDAHLVCWEIIRNPEQQPRVVNVQNQFGTARLLVGPAKQLCLPSWKSTTSGLPSDPAPPGLDHFECYKATYATNPVDTFENQPPTVVLIDQFAKVKATVNSPVRVCNPVQKTVPGQPPSPITNPDAHLVCFSIAVTPTVTRHVFAKNQFGTGQLTTLQSKQLCLPSFTLPQVSQIAAGFDHTCVILHNGTVRCWGNNSLGQLGLGNTNYIGGTSDTLPDSVPPVDLGPGRTALQISAGYDTTCALLDNHKVLCWGNGAGGALGHGDQRDIGDNETPGSVGPIDLGGNHTAVAVAAGASYNCAILDDDSVKCWGSGSYGELGYGNTTSVNDPSTVGPVSLGAGRTAVAIETPTNHTCVIVNTGGVMCWGMNLVGALGYGYNETVNQNIGDDETPDSVGTIDLGGHTALQVAGGDHHTCAILDDHTLRCWGTSWRGINGYPGGTDYYSPPTAPVDLGAGRTALSIDGGADHNCAVLDDQSVRCWGFGDDGRLGYGNTSDIGDNETPGSAGPVNLGPGRTADAVSAGRWHSCALMDTGDVRCWGEGSLLGYGNTTTIGDNETPDTAGPVSLGD
jgi:alpha-tubulin suppressor-like RCC1 family protein